uniref:Acetylglutamate kinase n=1 Tax=Nemalion vermiculare TaxID=935621 RepID=UPI00257FAEAF|nr:Acetylglutamate kinase [Nemalion vermiculare]WGV34355.1 Acetylglutamate kinase [Nemalion vermiculare]
MNYSDKIALIEELLPVMISLKGKIVVVKYGGSAMKNNNLTQQVIQNIRLLSKLGINFVIVHGGGPVINEWLEKVNIAPKFQDGVRVTDKSTMDIVEMVLAGKINTNLVKLLNHNDVNAIGLSGQDDNFILADPISKSQHNLVANVQSIDTELLQLLILNNYTPVISPIASGPSGESYNVNADVVAGAIASALKAHQLLMLTDTAGILSDPDDPSSRFDSLTINHVNTLIDNNVITGGMLPKINACTKAITEGVSSVEILDGRVPNSILLSLLTNLKVGSVISN